MLAVFCGADTKSVIEERNTYIHKTNDFNESSIFDNRNSLDITLSSIVETAQSVSLFGVKYVYVYNDILVLNELDKQTAQILQDSQHLFIFEVDSLLAPQKKVITNSGALLHEIEKIPKKTKAENNPFVITDALWMRNKKVVWLEYIKSIDAGEYPEAILGRIFWALKLLVLVLRYPEKKDTDLHISPFVFKKIKSAQKLYTLDEVLHLYTILLGLKSGDTFATDLEKVLLEKI